MEIIKFNLKYDDYLRQLERINPESENWSSTLAIWLKPFSGRCSQDKNELDKAVVEWLKSKEISNHSFTKDQELFSLFLAFRSSGLSSSQKQLFNSMSDKQACLLSIEDQGTPTSHLTLSEYDRHLIKWAAEINQDKQSLQSFIQEHGKEALMKIAPFLHTLRIDHRMLPSLSLEELEQFLKACPNLIGLHLENSFIQRLPESLNSLRKLSCSHCSKLTEIPTSSHLEVLELCQCNALEELRGELTHLEIMTIQDCKQLSRMPSVCPTLVTLYCRKCPRLTITLKMAPELNKLIVSSCKSLCLGESMPKLEWLECLECNDFEVMAKSQPLLSKMQCQSIPNLKEIGFNMPSLVTLNVHDCPILRRLPDHLESLESLHLSEVHELTSLPQGLLALNTLRCRGCPQLRSLPHSVFNGALKVYECVQTGIPDAITQRIKKYIKSEKEKTILKKLTLALELWNLSAEIKTDLSSIETFSEVERELIFNWLQKISITKDFSSTRMPYLAKAICEIITYAHENQEFKKQFFSQLSVNNSGCQDRAAMNLNELYSTLMLLKLPEDASLEGKLLALSGTARAISLRKAIAKMISEMERSTQKGIQESVEVYLYYETKLRERLKLTTLFHTSNYGEMIGNRIWIDEEKLIQMVEEDYLEELVSLPAFLELPEFRSVWEMSVAYQALQEEAEKAPGETDSSYDERLKESKEKFENEKACFAVNWVKEKLS